MIAKYLLLGATVVTAALGGASLREPMNNGALGDVKYSVLEPDLFKEVNGDGWELLAGQKNLESSELCKKLRVMCEQLYDARGVFLRGMNLQQDPNVGDPETGRAVGSVQSDSFAKHTHGLGYSTGAGDAEYSSPTSFNAASAGAGVIGTILWKGVGAYREYPRFVDTQPGDPKRPYLERVGGSETRPRNIALFVYVRVR